MSLLLVYFHVINIVKSYLQGKPVCRTAAFVNERTKNNNGIQSAPKNRILLFITAFGLPIPVVC